MATPEAVAQLRERLGLNHSVWIQFADYIRHIFQGDLGISIFTSNPVTTDLLDRAPATLELIGYSLVLMVVTAIVLAVASAVWRGSFIDIFVRIYGLAAGAIPDFWIGLLLIFFFTACWAGQLRPLAVLMPSLHHHTT
jgi:peptide/nickel transport system permease protein